MAAEAPALYEAEHVHRVYEHIAPHFAATRFKPWPIVDTFLRAQPAGSVGLDIGCGNGKYLTVNPSIFVVGSDRSPNLVKIAHDRKIQEAFVADALDLPHPDSNFDFAISIAVIHHFSSSERRIAAIRSILATLKRPSNGGRETYGKALIYVWALEQKTSRRGWDEGDQQDVFVPWVMSKRFSCKKEQTGQASLVAAESQVGGQHLERLDPEVQRAEQKEEGVTYQRYYHLYRKGELEADIAVAGGDVLESGYERDNWWAICGPSI